MTSRIGGILAAFVVILLCLAGTAALTAFQDRSCRAKGAERVTTYGFNYICVGPDGRIIP